MNLLIKNKKDAEIAFFLNILLAQGIDIPILHKIYFSNKYTIVYKLGIPQNVYQDFIYKLWGTIRQDNDLKNLAQSSDEKIFEVAYLNLLLNMRKTDLDKENNIEIWTELSNYLLNSYQLNLEAKDLYLFMKNLLLNYENFHI